MCVQDMKTLLNCVEGAVDSSLCSAALAQCQENLDSYGTPYPLGNTRDVV